MNRSCYNTIYTILYYNALATSVLEQPATMAASSVPEAVSYYPPGSASGTTLEQMRLVQRIWRTKNYYEVLDVSTNAESSTIKKAYYQLARKLHHDKNQAPGATNAFQKLTKVLQCLMDEEMREAYDRYGDDGDAVCGEDTVFIGDLRLGYDEAEIRSIFEAYGKIRYFEFIPCPSLSATEAFITFASAEDAKFCVDNLNGKVLEGLTTPIRVCFKTQMPRKRKHDDEEHYIWV